MEPTFTHEPAPSVGGTVQPPNQTEGRFRAALNRIYSGLGQSFAPWRNSEKSEATAVRCVELHYEKSIIVVDDDIDICSTLVDIFKAEGYDTNSAYNAGVAIEKIQASNFGILLTDLRMENMDGIQLVQKVIQINPKIIIFMMTAYPRDSRINEAYSNGVVKVFEKPFEVEDMLEIFKKEIARRDKKN